MMRSQMAVDCFLHAEKHRAFISFALAISIGFILSGVLWSTTSISQDITTSILLWMIGTPILGFIGLILVSVLYLSLVSIYRFFKKVFRSKLCT